MDLVRQILIATEKGETHFSGFDDKEVEGHIEVMERAGLIFGAGRNLWGMTWSGFELLDAIRDDSLWKKAKSTLLKEGASWTVELLKRWVTDQISRQQGIGGFM